MSRFAAVLLFCLTLCAPAFATDEAGGAAEGGAGPAESTPAPVSRTAVPELEDLPREILDRLDADQIAEILAAREETKLVLGVQPDSIGNVAILVPLGFFLTILLGLTAALVVRYRKHAQLQETLRLMIDKGAEIPPELIAPPDPPYRDLRRGVILLGVGLSVAIFLGLENGFAEGDWALGLIPGFIGAGYLLIWRIARRSESG